MKKNRLKTAMANNDWVVYGFSCRTKFERETHVPHGTGTSVLGRSVAFRTIVGRRFVGDSVPSAPRSDPLTRPPVAARSRSPFFIFFFSNFCNHRRYYQFYQSIIRRVQRYVFELVTTTDANSVVPRIVDKTVRTHAHVPVSVQINNNMYTQRASINVRITRNARACLRRKHCWRNFS